MRDWVFGEEGADFASPENLQAVQTFKTWVDNGWIDGPAANGLDYDQAWQEFAEGDGVFLPQGSWQAAGLYETRWADNVGFIAPPPGRIGQGRRGRGAVAAVPHLEQVGATRTSPRRSSTS